MAKPSTKKAAAPKADAAASTTQKAAAAANPTPAVAGKPVAPKTLPKPAAAPKAAAAAKEPKAPPAYEVNSVVTFVGYANKPENASFEPGMDLFIADITPPEGERGMILACYKLSDLDAYRTNPEDPNLVGEELLAAEVKPSRKKLPAVVEPEEPIEVVDIGEMVEYMKAEDPIETGVGILRNMQKEWFYLGGILAHAFHDDLFRSGKYAEKFGPEKFPLKADAWDAFSREYFEMAGRSALARADAYLVYSRIPNFDPETLGEVGFAKAVIAARYITMVQDESGAVTESNVEDVLKVASETPASELTGVMKSTFTSDGSTEGGSTAAGPARIAKTKYTFSLFADQAEGVNLILENAKKQVGTSDLNQVFEHIIQEWAKDHLAPAQVQKANAAVSRKGKELTKAGLVRPKLGQKAAA